MKSQVESFHYFKKSYDTKERFCSYWHQIDEIVSLHPNLVLEIGIGNGFVSDYLIKREYTVVTLDKEIRLRPNYVSSVLNLPFRTNSFDVVAAFEVFEHIPYKDFQIALKEIWEVTKNHFILSLPDCTRVYRLHLHFPRIGIKRKMIPIPRLRIPDQKFNGEHYWEIGNKQTPLKRVISDIQRVGFVIDKSYRVFEKQNHRFFILKKIAKTER